jgi:hypothetical protein
VTYRERLRLEGASLALSGAAGAIGLLVLRHDEATAGPVSTIVQVAIVAVLMATIGARSVRRSIERAAALDGDPGSGQPTQLWLHPLIVAGLTLPFGLTDAWDAGLRVCGGCTVVGLAQIAFSALVAREEARRGVRFYRVPGSSLFTGTKLGAAR